MRRDRPCPECGGKLWVHNKETSDWAGKYYVSCETEECTYRVKDLNISQAMDLTIEEVEDED